MAACPNQSVIEIAAVIEIVATLVALKLVIRAHMHTETRAVPAANSRERNIIVALMDSSEATKQNVSNNPRHRKVLRKLLTAMKSGDTWIVASRNTNKKDCKHMRI